MKKILYLDMDNVLVDFESAFKHFPDETLARYEGDLDDIPGIFEKMDPMPGAIEAFHELSGLFDTYILSTAPWDNPSAWTHKVEWVHKHLGGGPDSPAYKRLILTHHKHLNIGDFLVDDRTKNGADRFPGEHIHFGTEVFADWSNVVDYLRGQAQR